MAKKNGLLFTVAQNGYATRYRDCIETQRQYCARFGYEHVVITSPGRFSKPAMSAWLKIPLMRDALLSGHRVVMFLDADCSVQERAPALDWVLKADRSVHMALGRSGRVNSGVIVARGDGRAVEFFNEVLRSMTTPIPETDRQGLRFENGNVIYCAKRSSDIEELDVRWNNSRDPDLADYVRHFTGPMRDLRTEPAFSWPIVTAIKVMRTASGAQPPERPQQFRDSVLALSRRCVSKYPGLSAR